MTGGSIDNNNLSVMTYNIRLDTANDGENGWPHRKDFLLSQVQFHGPDILSVQEAKPNQMADLKNTLNDYASIGIGRDGVDQGEHASIFYNTNKLKVENENTFWLSETPDVMSQGWDGKYSRICTHGLFTILDSGKQFWMFNTHLDHMGQEAQRQGIQLILNRIATLNIDNLPVILTGDFNVEPNSKLIKDLKLQMTDSKDIAKISFGSDGTFNGFKFDEPVTRRIDYIMLSNDDFEVERYGVFSSSIDLRYPSDHFPVFVGLRLR